MTEEPLQCPLITTYTTLKGLDPETLEKLYLVRKWDIERDEAGVIHNPIPFKWPSLLRKTLWDIDNDCDTGVPLELRQYQIQMIHHLIRMDKFINGDAVGLGKAQPLDAKILTPSGWKLMGEMMVGQEVVDPDGGSSFVEGVYPQGKVDIYRVELNDGSVTECCGGHLWTVQTPEDRMRGNERTLTTLQLLKQGLTRTRGNGNVISKFFTPVAVPTVWKTKQALPIRPYTLGALLGDGGIKYGVTITSADAAVIQRIKTELPEGLGLRQCDDTITWHISKGRVPGRGVYNSYITALRDLKLFGCGSSNKFIPEVYLRSSLTERMEVLRGLMDTDGECSKAGLCYFATISHQLALDIAELVRSLGGVAKVRDRKPKWYSHKGEKRLRQPGYTVTIKTHEVPFHLKRKSERWKLPQFARAFHSIHLVGKKPAQCIKVGSKRHLYVTDDYIVTHNTLDVIAAAAWLKQRKPDYKVVIVTTKSTTLQWADEFLRFSHLRPYVMKDTYRGLSSSAARYAQMESFFRGDKKDVIIVKYDSIKGVRKKTKEKFDADGVPIKGGKEAESDDVKFFTKIFKENKENLILVFDEVHKFKGSGTAIRNLVFSIARSADKVWGLTATVMKNSLNEFYAVATALGICPFGFMLDFTEEFCIMRPQYIGGGRKKMVLVGYQNVAKFKAGIRPFFLGRSQRQVKEPLPRLSTTYHPLDLTDQQIDLLDDIKSGAFILPPALVKDKDGDFHEMERDPDNLMAQPLTAKILTPFGWKLMEEMSLGQIITDPDGGSSTVTGVYPQGIKEVYRLTTKSGASTECTGDHLWLVQDYFNRYASQRSKNKWCVRTTQEIRDRGLVYKGLRWNKFKQFLPIPTPTVFDSPLPLPIPPYTLGVLLGDGSLTCSIKFAAHAEGKDDIIRFVEDELPSTLKVHSVPASRYHLISSKSRADKNSHLYLLAARKLGIYGLTASTKYIPLSYLRGTVEQRQLLLQGLMDTDGCCTQDGVNVFTVTSKRLADDVAELVRSLGGIATLNGPHQSPIKNRRPVWTVRFRTSFNPYRMARKAVLWRNVEPANAIVSIEYVGNSECQCIRTSSRRSLYITDDFIVTHNTQLSVQQLVANHPALLDPSNLKEFHTAKLSPKEEALLDMLDGDLAGEKVIVFSKYKLWIDRLEKLTKDGHFTNRKFLRITGNENEKQRNDNKRLFQGSPDHDLIVINAAGIEGINLQQAAHMVLLDVPWSWGDLIQLVGRMVRMASPHTACTLHLFVAKGTIDEYAVETLKGKKGVFEKILGESHSAGILDDGALLDLDSGMEDGNSDEEYKALLKAHVKSVGMKEFLDGDKIEEARGNEEYQMVFQRKKKSGTRKKKSIDLSNTSKWGVIEEL